MLGYHKACIWQSFVCSHTSNICQMHAKYCKTTVLSFYNEYMMNFTRTWSTEDVNMQYSRFYINCEFWIHMYICTLFILVKSYCIILVLFYRQNPLTYIPVLFMCEGAYPSARVVHNSWYKDVFFLRNNCAVYVSTPSTQKIVHQLIQNVTLWVIRENVYVCFLFFYYFFSVCTPHTFLYTGKH